MNHHFTWSSLRKLVGFLTLLCLVFVLFRLVLRPPKKNKQIPAPLAQESPEVLPPRLSLLAETSAESIDESIEALPSFLDRALAKSIGMDLQANESYGLERLVIPKLNRVRKLLAQIDDSQKPHYTAVFLRKIDESMTGYVESWKKMLAVAEARGEFTEPSPYHRKRATAGALVYILTEWDCHAALPTFARLLEQPGPIPVNRVFLLYSCHVLIASLPTDGFSAEKLGKLKEYKQLAGKCFPAVSRVRVPAWNAKYEESDFRAVILEQNIPIESEPGILLRIYPDLSNLEDLDTHQLQEEADILQRVMLRFLRMK